MRTILNRINAALACVDIALLAVLVCCVTWQVVSRFILKSPSTTTDELARLLFINLGLLGAAYAAAQNRHLAIDLLPMMLHGAARRRLAIFIQLFVMTFAVVIMIYGGGLLALDTLHSGQTSPALGWQMGYVYLCIPVSGLLIALNSLAFVVEKVRVRDDASDIASVP